MPDKAINSASDLIGSAELYVVEHGFTPDGEGWVIIGSPEPGESGSFEARRLAQRHAETKMGWRSAGLTGFGPANAPNRSIKVMRDGREEEIELYCSKIRVAGS